MIQETLNLYEISSLIKEQGNLVLLHLSQY